PRLLQQLRGLPAPYRVEVALVVRDVLDLQRVELEPEPPEIDVGFVQELARELLAILVDLFRRERGQHAAQVALEGLARDRHDLLARVAEEALDRVAELPALARDLHVRDALHVERDAALRVRALDAQL